MNKPTKVIAYLRVSTRKQGDSGLGLEAQREYIQKACQDKGYTLSGEFVDVASGSISPTERKECQKAIQEALSAGAVLMVAKLDRLSRDVEHIAALMKQCPFKVATMPDADAFQLHLYAALAQQERDFIRQRTKDALQALKARSEAGDTQAKAKVANRDKGRTAANEAEGYKAATASRVTRSNEFAVKIASHLKAALYDGHATLQALADYLNKQGIQTSRGSKWTSTAVSRAMKKAGLPL